MSRKTTKSILSRDEISLLLNSEEPKNQQIYGNLHDILLQIKDLKAITMQQLINLKLNDIGVAALTYNKQSLIDNVKNEWYVENHSAEDPDKKVKCGLCNTPNKYVFYIRNRINKKQLNVGSSCIKNFPGIEGYIEYKYRLDKTIQTQKEIIRRTEFHTHFPDCVDIINSANDYFDNLPILLPYELYFSLQDTVKNLRVIYKKYIKHGKVHGETEETTFQSFAEMIKIYSDLKLKANEFINKNIDEKLICKRSEIDWLIQNKRHSLLKEISRNDGMYSIDTIGQIASINFIKTNFYLIKKALKAEDIILIMPKNSHSNFQFLLQYGNNLSYNIIIKKFMKYIGSHCLLNGNFTFNKNDLIKVSELSTTNNNIEIVTSCLKDAIKINRLSYALLIDDRTHTIFLYQKTSKLIKEYTYSVFINLYDKNKLRTNINDIDFVWYLIKNDKWITAKIQKRRGIDNKINKLYYHQYIEPYKY